MVPFDSRCTCGRKRFFGPSIQSLNEASTSLLVCMADPKAFNVYVMFLHTLGSVRYPSAQSASVACWGEFSWDFGDFMNLFYHRQSSRLEDY